MKSRILELSHKHKLGHLSSNLQTACILEQIYQQDNDARVIVSMGHAGLALYCALEKYQFRNAETLLDELGAQPKLSEHVLCATGSLGQGLTVAVGYALASPTPIHCIISDGECAEGCVWEALAFIKERALDNLCVHVNMNGYCALSAVDKHYLASRLLAFLPGIIIHDTSGVVLPSFLHGIHGHYKVMSDAEYAEVK